MTKASTGTRRSYRQFCGLAKALDVVGERWTMLVVRNLLLGPLRYSDLLRGLPGITTNLLAKRLKEMEALRLIEKTSDGQSYQLTTLGAGLEPAVHALGRWGWKRMDAPSRGDYRSFDYLAVALRRRYRGHTALRVELVADGVPYRLTLGAKRALVERGAMPQPDVRLSGPGASLAQVFLDESARKRVPSDVTVEGSASSLRALLTAFAPSDDAGPAAA